MPTRSLFYSPYKTDSSVSQRCSSCFPLFKLFFNFSPRQIHLSPNVVQVVSLCPKLFFNFSQRQIHLSDKVVQIVSVVQVVFQLLPKTESSVSQRCSSCFPLSKLFFNFSPRHLSDKVVQVVPVVQVVFFIFSTDRFICLKVVL